MISAAPRPGRVVDERRTGSREARGLTQREPKPEARRRREASAQGKEAVQQARSNRGLPVHRAVDVRFPHLHRRRDGLQPLHLVQQLQPRDQHREPCRASTTTRGCSRTRRSPSRSRTPSTSPCWRCRSRSSSRSSLAMLLNRMTRGAGAYRTLYYLPKMTPAVATASVFFLLLNGNTGAINQGLRALRHRGPAVADRSRNGSRPASS